VLGALLVTNHRLQQRLDALEVRTLQEDDGPMPRSGWNMHLMGNLETFLDVNHLEPEAAQQLRALTDESMRTSTLIQQRFLAGQIDCFERLVATKRMLEHHETQAATLLQPEQCADYRDIVCPTGQRGCLANGLRDLELVALLER
jgi:hypothetical protein